MIRLLVVDDQLTVRQGLRMRLALEPDLLVISEASNAEEALTLAQMLRPDIILMDVEMPGMNGIAATEALHRTVPDSVVVMLTIHDDDTTQSQARAAGAAALIEKRAGDELLLGTIRRLANPH
jgi:DNA-binding NarL/FixJ family response regulator